MLIVKCGERRVVREGRWIVMLVNFGGFWEGQIIEELIYTMEARARPNTDISAVSTLLRDCITCSYFLHVPAYRPLKISWNQYLIESRTRSSLGNCHFERNLPVWGL